jgi:hypothetical protein
MQAKGKIDASSKRRLIAYYVKSGFQPDQRLSRNSPGKRTEAAASG